MIDAPAQGEVPVSTSNELPDRFAVLSEAEKRVHDLLDSSAAEKVLQQAGEVATTLRVEPTQAETPSVSAVRQEGESTQVDEIEALSTTETSPYVAEKAEDSVQKAAAEDEDRIATAQQLLAEAAEIQKTIQPQPVESAPSTPTATANDSAEILSESFTARQEAIEPAPVAEGVPTPEALRPALSAKETEKLTREVTAFEQKVKEKDDDTVLKVADIEQASHTLSPLSGILTTEQNRRDIGIRAAIAAHRESLKAA